MRSREEALSTTWLSFRRVIAFGFGFLLVLGALRNIYLAFTLQDLWYVLYAIFGAGLAYMSYFVGRYGKVRKYSTVAQDVDAHKKRVSKYGWRW